MSWGCRNSCACPGNRITMSRSMKMLRMHLKTIQSYGSMPEIPQSLKSSTTTILDSATTWYQSSQKRTTSNRLEVKRTFVTPLELGHLTLSMVHLQLLTVNEAKLTSNQWQLNWFGMKNISRERLISLSLAIEKLVRRPSWSLAARRNQNWSWSLQAMNTWRRLFGCLMNRTRLHICGYGFKLHSKGPSRLDSLVKQTVRYTS